MFPRLAMQSPLLLTVTLLALTSATQLVSTPNLANVIRDPGPGSRCDPPLLRCTSAFLRGNGVGVGEDANPSAFWIVLGRG